ncbi:MAG: hypothetical protein M3P83_09985 [Actinomycetota bacterium]|nr:hypothetical protein [Actinomycetota bacterium]
MTLVSTDSNAYVAACTFTCPGVQVSSARVEYVDSAPQKPTAQPRVCCAAYAEKVVKPANSPGPRKPRSGNRSGE